jgi:hypothetical protein
MTIQAADLAQFTGAENWYLHPLARNILYTEGIKYLADNARAYWLIDAIVSWVKSPEFKKHCEIDPRVSDMHFWKLTRNEDNSAVLTAVPDSDEPAFIRQDIEFTDFPLDSISIWAASDGATWTLYLPSEH